RSCSRLRVLRSTILPCASTPHRANEFLAKSRPKRIMSMDLLTRCLEGLTNLHSGTSMPQSGEVHVIREAERTHDRGIKVPDDRNLGAAVESSGTVLCQSRSSSLCVGWLGFPSLRVRGGLGAERPILSVVHARRSILALLSRVR